MAITPAFTQSDIRQMFERKKAQIELAIALRLSELGEMCVNEARNEGSYMDQTGNLRSSTGYVIVDHGRVVAVDFKQVSGSQPAQGLKGAYVGEAYARQLATRYSKGYALIVVAGMRYAAHVEATGRNVLNSAELLAERELPRMIAQLKAQIKAA